MKEREREKERWGWVRKRGGKKEITDVLKKESKPLMNSLMCHIKKCDKWHGQKDTLEGKCCDEQKQNGEEFIKSGETWEASRRGYKFDKCEFLIKKSYGGHFSPHLQGWSCFTQRKQDIALLCGGQTKIIHIENHGEIALCIKAATGQRDTVDYAKSQGTQVEGVLI